MGPVGSSAWSGWYLSSHCFCFGFLDKEPHGVDEDRKALASLFLSKSLEELRRRESDVSIKLRQLFEPEFNAVANTGKVPPVLYVVLLTLRRCLPVSTQDIDGGGEVPTPTARHLGPAHDMGQDQRQDAAARW